MIEKKTLVEVKNLKEYFNITTGMFTSKPLKAVDDVYRRLPKLGKHLAGTNRKLS